MEIETAVRSALPLLIFVINNNGVYFGLDAATYNQTELLPSTALTPDTRYDLIADVSSFLRVTELSLGMRR
jgi:2-hydroxyacyl-CoA lyase 1